MKKEISVLVIEDGKSDLLFIQQHFQQLKEWNVNVVSARTFSEGRGIIESQKIDLCFLDYYIDNQSADKFLKEVVLIRDFVPVILVSGASEDKLAEVAEEFELDDYLTKSDISQKLLSRIIRYCLSTNNARVHSRNQEGKYNNLINNSLEAVFTADKDFHIIKSNQSFKELIKYQDNRTLDFRELFIEDDLNDFFSALVGDSERKLKKTKLKDLKGEILEVYVAISRILSGSDNAAYQVVIHDITELERARIKLYENEKTSLIQRMARIIGHEVRNPLTNILLASEELKDDNQENENSVLMLNMIHRNANRISDLIDNFLNNTKNSSLVRENVIIEEVILNAFNLCKDRILLKDIRYTLDGINNKTEIKIDPNKIQIVLTNIIINATEALEYIEKPFLEISLQTIENSVIISVKDNGVGMTNEVLDNLFQPFYSNKQGGLGLGMTNSKNIIDDHGAKISVETASGVGTLFKIEFSKLIL